MAETGEGILARIITLSGLCDAAFLNNIAGHLYSVTGLSLAICDPDASCLARSGWEAVCKYCPSRNSDFPSGCFADTTVRDIFDGSGTCVTFACRNSVQISARCIIADGKPAGFILSGQFYFSEEVPDFSIITADPAAYPEGTERLRDGLKELQVVSRDKLDKVMALFHDIVTACINAKVKENELGESEGFYRDMFINMGSSIGVFDENNLFVLVNRQFASLLGYSREEIEGKKPWTEFVVQSDQDRLLGYHDDRMGMPRIAPPVYEFDMIDRFGVVRKMLNHVVVIPGTTKSVISLVDITDRKRAEEALARSENMYRAIFENTGNATILIEEDTTMSLVNTQWVNLSGYSKEEQEGKMKWTEFVVPEDLDRMVGYHKKRRDNSGNAPWMYEFHYIRRNGEIRDIVVHVVMIPGTGRSVASLLDITERKKAEKALQESEQLLSDIIDFLPDATFAIDRDGKVTAWNRAIEVMTGAMKADMIGKGNNEYSIPFYGTRRPILIDLAFESDEVVAARYDNVRREGELLIAEAFVPKIFNGRGGFLWGIVTPLRDSSGKIIGAIESIRDISEYRRVEEALRESENIYRAIFENTGSATIMIEEDTTISLVNSQWVTLSGYSKEDQEGKMSWTQFVVPEDRARMVEYHKKRRIDSSDAPWKYEFRFISRSGEIRNIMVHVVMIPGTSRSIASLVDVTDRKRAEEERLEIERKLLHAQKLESLGLLAGGIAHDFNNLLLAVLGNLDIALKKLQPENTARMNIEQAVIAGRHASELTRQMLAYSGKGNFIITRVDLSRLVEENYHMLRAAIPKNITLELNLGTQVPPVMADAGQIQQVILNLITNAAEAIGDGQGDIVLSTGEGEYDREYLERSRIDVKPAPGRFVWIEVRDSGCGMDQEVQQKLFDPFFTTKITGRGLGMSAVMGVVMGHNGAIVIESRTGAGSVVRVLFPASGETAIEDNLTGITPDAGPEEEKVLSGTVLVVDDEKMVRDMTCEMVEIFGFTTLQASDGSEAVEVFTGSKEDISCVILDLTMPRMDGLATFIKLRSIKPDVQVILASGFSEQDATSRFSGQGLAGFLQKPYSIEMLRKELERIVGKNI